MIFILLIMLLTMKFIDDVLKKIATLRNVTCKICQELLAEWLLIIVSIDKGGKMKVHEQVSQVKVFNISWNNLRRKMENK